MQQQEYQKQVDHYNTLIEQHLDEADSIAEKLEQFTLLTEVEPDVIAVKVGQCYRMIDQESNYRDRLFMVCQISIEPLYSLMDIADCESWDNPSNTLNGIFGGQANMFKFIR